MKRLPLELGIVSDEISPDFAQAVHHGLEWGIRRYELRVLSSGRVPEVSPEDVRTVQELAGAHRLRITALSPGIFKHPVSRAAEIERELTVTLPTTLELARRLSAPLIIVFGFQRGEGPGQEEHAREYFRRASELAGAAGCRLAIENEPGFLCDSGSRTHTMIREVGSPHLGANWDPCNAYGTEETPYPDGYAAVRPSIFNVHVKDTRSGALIECVPVGEGAVDWEGQLSALVRDRPVEHITIETHCLPLVEKSRQNVTVLTRMLERLAAGERSVSHG